MQKQKEAKTLFLVLRTDLFSPRFCDSQNLKKPATSAEVFLGDFVGCAVASDADKTKVYQGSEQQISRKSAKKTIAPYKCNS